MNMRIAAILVTCCAPRTASSQLKHYSPFFGGNGNWFEAILEPNLLTWDEASQRASLMGGHLATLTSNNENIWVYSNLASSSTLWYRNSFGDMVGPWIGGKQNSSSPAYSEPAGGWTWITGEAWLYAAWHSGQPNNAGGGGQDRLQFWAGNSSAPKPLWQDVQNTTTSNPKGFLVEYDFVPPNRPVQFPTNEGGTGHWYELVLVKDGVSWQDAHSSSQARGGYVATLTTQTENDWVFDNLAGNPDCWFVDSFGFLVGPFIGGYQDTGSPSYSEPSGGWTWVSGETWNFTMWAPGQPNDARDHQNYLHYWTSESSPLRTWQDNLASGPNRPIAFVVEYNANPICLADVNNDGSLTPADFSAWISSFVLQDPSCDQNSDDLCTPSDFSAWISNYNIGC